MKNVELLHCVFGRSSQEIENHVKLRVSCFLIGWFSQSLRIQWETFVCFCLRSKKHPKKTMTDEGRTERIELFSYFMAHFKSLGEKINMVASREGISLAASPLANSSRASPAHASRQLRRLENCKPR